MDKNSIKTPYEALMCIASMRECCCSESLCPYYIEDTECCDNVEIARDVLKDKGLW